MNKKDNSSKTVIIVVVVIMGGLALLACTGIVAAISAAVTGSVKS